MQRFRTPTWRIVAAATSFGLFGLGGALLGVLVLPLVWLLGFGPWKLRRQRCMRAVSWGLGVFHGYMRLVRLVDYRPSEQAQFRAALRATGDGSPIVVVCNHPSLVDTTAVLSAHSQLVCIVAPWFSRKAFLRPLLSLSGHLCIVGDSLRDALAVFVEAEATLRAGSSLLVFPEGTRSPPEGLGEFSRGAFELAVRCQVPVLPVAIQVEPRVLDGARPWHELPNVAAAMRLEPLPPLAPAADPEDVSREARRLSRRAREALANALSPPARKLLVENG